MKGLVALFVLAATALAVSAAASADPTFTAISGVTGVYETSDFQRDNGAVGVESHSPTVQNAFVWFDEASSSAGAGPGVVRARAQSHQHMDATPDHGPGLCFNCFVIGSEAMASMKLEDVLFTAPSGQPDTYIPVRLYVSVDGLTSVEAAAAGPFIGAARGSVATDLYVGLGSEGASGHIDVMRSATPQDGEGDPLVTKTGLFETFDGAGELVIGPVMVPTGVPIVVYFELHVASGVSSQVDGVSLPGAPALDALAVDDFGNTVQFPTSGNVFDLPAGYRVDSPSGGIVNNRSTGGTTPPPSTDTTPPAIACDQPDTLWHAANVSLNCTATDPSGLQDGADATFALTTDVADGEERADAMTGTREVCDSLGNCATVGPLGPIKVDKKAPTIAISSPTDGAAYTLGQAVNANYQCSDDGSGVASCAGPVANGGGIDTASVGAKNFEVAARDAAGNTASRLVTYAVGYGICTLYDQTQVRKLGSTVPIKLQLCDSAGLNVSSPALLVRAAGLVRVSDNVSGTVQDSGNANPDSDFRYDAGLGGSGGYIFNLSTKTLTAGIWSIRIIVSGDPTAHEVQFQVR